MNAAIITLDNKLLNTFYRIHQYLLRMVGSDKALIASFKKTGDTAIIGELYNRYGELVYGVCMKHLKDEHLSKEITQEIFSKLIDKISKNYKIDHFKHWLLTVTKNECITYFRKNKVKIKEQEEYSLTKKNEDSFMENDAFERLIIENKSEKLLLALNDALHKLSHTQKLCIEEFYFSNSSYKAIAKAHQLSENEVKSAIQNGKRMLKQSILKSI